MSGQGSEEYLLNLETGKMSSEIKHKTIEFVSTYKGNIYFFPAHL